MYAGNKLAASQIPRVVMARQGSVLVYIVICSWVTTVLHGVEFSRQLRVCRVVYWSVL